MRTAFLSLVLLAPTTCFVLAPLPSSSRCSAQQLRLVAILDDSVGEGTLDGTIDALVRAEVEAAFAGLEKTLQQDDDDALKLIEQKGQEVMQSVLDKLEADGELLSSSLLEQIDQLSMTRQKQMLAEYDESTAKLQRRMLEERQTIRDEMERLSALNDDYKQLSGSGTAFNKDSIVSGLSFIVGLTYVSAAINEALKVASGGGNDASAATVALNAALGVAGVGYHFYRKGQAE